MLFATNLIRCFIISSCFTFSVLCWSCGILAGWHKFAKKALCMGHVWTFFCRKGLSLDKLLNCHHSKACPRGKKMYVVQIKWPIYFVAACYGWLLWNVTLFEKPHIDQWSHHTRTHHKASSYPDFSAYKLLRKNRRCIYWVNSVYK